MGMKIGMPIMKLDRLPHFNPKPNANSGNARAVLKEALEERQSNDPDLDRNKTKDNIYTGFTKSGDELCDYWERLAEDYKVIDKNGKEKSLRSDAGIGFAGIIKPNIDSMRNLKDDEKLRLLNDAIECVKVIYSKRGMVIDATVIHVDEGSFHLHYFGHDPEYRVSKKTGLPFKKKLNVTEFPPMMRAKGWDVEDLTGFQEETEGMSEEEIKAEKERRRKNRKNGLSSKDYKAMKDIENEHKILDKREERIDLKASLQCEKDEEQRRKDEEQRRKDERQRRKDEEQRKKDHDLDVKERQIDARSSYLDDRETKIKNRDKSSMKEYESLILASESVERIDILLPKFEKIVAEWEKEKGDSKGVSRAKRDIKQAKLDIDQVKKAMILKADEITKDHSGNDWQLGD